MKTIKIKKLKLNKQKIVNLNYITGGDNGGGKAGNTGASAKPTTQEVYKVTCQAGACRHFYTYTIETTC